MNLSDDAARALRDSYVDLFLLAHALAGENRLSSADAGPLQRYVEGALDSNRRRLLTAGVPPACVDAAQLPVIALVDEAANRSPEFRQHWRPIQHAHYGHLRLGHTVFERLRALRLDPATPVALLELYARCLQWGLQGEYGADRADDLRSLREALANDILRKLGQLPELLPPLESAGAQPTQGTIPSFWWPAGMLAALMVLMWGGFDCASRGDVARTAQQVSVSAAAVRGGTSAFRGGE